MKEDVESYNYKLPLQLINSILVDYKLNVIEGKFRYKIIKNDFKNIAIIPFFKKIIINTGFLNWANEENKRHIKTILAHEVSHKNRFSRFWIEIFLLPFIITKISTIFILLISALLLSYGMIFLTQILIFLIHFVTYFLVYLVVFWLMRRNEYLADKGSVELGNLPDDMIEALFIILEVTEGKIKKTPKIIELFNTHPSIENRIKRLKGFEH